MKLNFKGGQDKKGFSKQSEQTIPVFSGHSIHYKIRSYFIICYITVAPSAVQLKLQHRSTTLTQECVECKTTISPFGTRTVIRTTILEVIGKQTGITTYHIIYLMTHPDTEICFTLSKEQQQMETNTFFQAFKQTALNVRT